MAELADAPDSGSGGRKAVGVQVPLLALKINPFDFVSIHNASRCSAPAEVPRLHFIWVIGDPSKSQPTKETVFPGR